MTRTPRTLVCAVALAASASAVYATHSWNNYHWARQSNPFTLKLGDNVSSQWDASLGRSATDWTKSTVLNMTVVAGGANPKNCRPTSGRVEVCNSTYGSNGWLGLAQIWLSGGHISQGVAKMNDTYYNTAKYNTAAWRNSVMCQEIGHTIGLGHNDEDFNTTTGTCMDYSNDPTQNQSPNQHDYDMLASIYAHLDSSTTVGQPVMNMPQGVAEMGGNSRAEWGQRVARSASGRTEVYALNVGRGQQIVTFVTYTEEHQHDDE